MVIPGSAWREANINSFAARARTSASWQHIPTLSRCSAQQIRPEGGGPACPLPIAALPAGVSPRSGGDLRRVSPGLRQAPAHGVQQRHDRPRAGHGPHRHRWSRSGKALVGPVARLRWGVHFLRAAGSFTSGRITAYLLYFVCFQLPAAPGVWTLLFPARSPRLRGRGCWGWAQAGHSHGVRAGGGAVAGRGGGGQGSSAGCRRRVPGCCWHSLAAFLPG